MRGPLPLVLALAAAACGGGEGASEIRASGHVEATEVRVASKVAGRIEAFLVEEGVKVGAGQELARIDVADVRLALEAARAERAQAEADLRLREAGPRAEEVAEAEALANAAAAELRAAEQDLERMEGLLAAGSGTRKARDDARARRDARAAALEAARQRVARLRAGSRPQEIAAARARVRAAAARVGQLEEQVAEARVTSPLEATLTERVAEEGELARPGTVLAVLTDLERPWLTAYVAEPDLGRIRVGQRARVVTDDGQAREGTLRWISSKAEFTPRNVQTRDERVKLVYKIEIALPNADGLFKAGMPAEARIAPAAAAP